MVRFISAAAVLLACTVATGETRMNTSAVEKELLQAHGEGQRERVARGLAQVARLWRAEDGDLGAFAREHFVSDPKKLQATFARFEASLEELEGHMNQISRALRRPVDLDLGPLLPVDPLFGGFDAAAHLTEDLFGSKLAFVALLNFPVSTLEDRLAAGSSWSRRQWAEARLTGRFSRRVPATVQQEMTRVASDAELYISEYNIWMHHLVDERGERLFPKGLRLISHWNLRDELRAAYADPKGLARQRMVAKVMERIVTQSIPASVIDNPRVDWNPFTNEVKAAPAATIEPDAPERVVKADPAREPDVRYQKLLSLYHAYRKADPFAPTAPTAMARGFEDAEIPEERVVELLTQVLASPLIARVGAEMERRLGRKLEPHDIWYSGFQARGRHAERDLDALARKRYPTPAAFAAEIPKILQKLGFTAKQARFLSERIVVDPSRGAGHAWPPGRRGDNAHLRTRVEKDGMNYKGYNIAVHELGHNAEQVISRYLVDSPLLAGVPITAITEALAFVFQARDLELLGLARPGAEERRQRALGQLWQTFEIAGVALVEIRAWHWMYRNPSATPAQVREATVGIAREIWNQYYAPVLGSKDTVLLGIYSHMLSTPLYLYNYPLGHLIAFQIEEHLDKQPGKLGAEFERMCRHGLVTPDEWMKHATGAPIGTAPLLRAVEAALR
jgi:hypothetical protein